jgi:hypothetical protein
MSDQFPLDFDSLNKGDVIEQARIEQIYNIKAEQDANEYRYKMMDLGDQIERECSDRGLLYRCDGLSIRIMTDEEAEARTWQRVRNGARSIARNTNRRASIDRSAFDEKQRAIAEHRDRVATAIMLENRKELRDAMRDERLLVAGKGDE